MEFNPRGELVPTVCAKCARCGLCLKVCPALEVGEPLSAEELFGQAPATQKDPHVGNFLAAFVGYSPTCRERAASGGMTTWTLEQLFRKGKIDAAVCVAASRKGDRLFEPVIVSSASGVLACSSTKYYPVEFSSCLRQILKNEGRYAIVALPCAVTAIRKAQRAVPLLRKRIRYVLGLACGHGVSKHYTGFLLAVLGLKEETTKRINFRYARRSLTADDYAFQAQGVSEKGSRPLFSRGLLGRLWGGRFFVPNACDFCDDLFAPLADATFMDAWLPEYITDPRGISIVVARQAELAELLEEGQREGTCYLRATTLERIRQSQSAALAYKTMYLPLRVARAERSGLKIPRSFPRAPVPCGLREKLAKIKSVVRDTVCLRTFDQKGRARPFWVALLAAYLRAQALYLAAGRRINRISGRIKRPKPGGMGLKAC
jgi:coenzyme F420 hydrogenase subunit beta